MRNILNYWINIKLDKKNLMKKYNLNQPRDEKAILRRTANRVGLSIDPKEK